MNAQTMNKILEDMSLGDRVRTLRKLRGLTQKELARAAGVSRATINYIERGRTRYLFPETLEGLRAALGVGKTILRNPPAAPSWARRPPGVRQSEEPPELR